jgi:hypothetical protein
MKGTGPIQGNVTPGYNNQLAHTLQSRLRHARESVTHREPSQATSLDSRESAAWIELPSSRHAHTRTHTPSPPAMRLQARSCSAAARCGGRQQTLAVGRSSTRLHRCRPFSAPGGRGRAIPARSSSEAAVQESAPAAGGKSVPSSSAWELDFCSRPLLDERGKKVWELLICDAERSFEYSQYFPNSKINSAEVGGAAGGPLARRGPSRWPRRPSPSQHAPAHPTPSPHELHPPLSLPAPAAAQSDGGGAVPAGRCAPREGEGLPQTPHPHPHPHPTPLPAPSYPASEPAAPLPRPARPAVAPRGTGWLAEPATPTGHATPPRPHACPAPLCPSCRCASSAARCRTSSPRPSATWASSPCPAAAASAS